MKSRRGFANAIWFYTLLFLLLLALSVVETFRIVPGGNAEPAARRPLWEKRQDNGNITDSPTPSTPAGGPATETVAITTAQTVPTTVNGPATTAGSGSSSGGDSGGDDGNSAAPPATTAQPGSGSSSSGTATAPTVVIGASPGQSNAGSEGSDSGSGSGSGGDASSTGGNTLGVSGGSTSGTSGGSSGSGLSGSSSGGDSSSGSASSSNGNTSGTESGSGSGSGPDSGSGSGSGTGSGTGTGSRLDTPGEDSSDLSGISPAAFFPTTSSRDTTASATAKKGLPALSTPVTRTKAFTSVGKPTTLKPSTATASQITVVTTTGSDGRQSIFTKHLVSTFVTTPVRTPSSVYTSTSTGQDTAGTGANTADGQIANKENPSRGMSSGAKVAVGVVVPLFATAAVVGIALYAMKKKKRAGSEDDEKGPNISGPMSPTGSIDPLNRSPSTNHLRHPAFMPNEDSSDPTLPNVRPHTPAMSMLMPLHPPSITGPAAPAPAAVAAAASARLPSISDPSPHGSTAGTDGASLMRSPSAISSLSFLSANTRNSPESRTPSPPSPLVEIPQHHTNPFEPSPFHGIAIGGAPTPQNPFEDPPSPTKSSDSSNGLSVGRYSFNSDHPSQSRSKTPSMTGDSSASNDRPFSGSSDAGNGDGDVNDSDSSERMSAISDAPVADARATQLYYPFGDTVMTPGGRIVPRPVGLNPNNINPGIGGVRPDGSRSQSAAGFGPSLSPSNSVGKNGYSQSTTPSAGPGRSNSTSVKRRSSLTIGAPRLPQLLEEDSGFSFDFDIPSSPEQRPQTSPEPSNVQTTTSATYSPSSSPPPSTGLDTLSVAESSEKDRMGGRGARPRAPSAGGYRKYRANNL